MSTPEKKCSVRGGGGGGLGSCDNLSGGAADMDRSLRFLEKHKVVLLGNNYMDGQSCLGLLKNVVNINVKLVKEVKTLRVVLLQRV